MFLLRLGQEFVKGAGLMAVRCEIIFVHKTNYNVGGSSWSQCQRASCDLWFCGMAGQLPRS